MTKKRPVPQTEKPLRGFRPDAALDRAMLKLQARDGIAFSEQIRRALDQWLATKDVGYTKEKNR